MDVIPATLKSLLPPCIDVNLYSDMSHQQAALTMLHQSLLKKLEPRGENKIADKAALELFLESNARCSRFVVDETSVYCEILEIARERLYHHIHSDELQTSAISIAKCFDRLRPGPGSSRGTKLTDFVGKVFSSRITSYDQALWQYYRESIPLVWRAAEKLRCDRYGEYSIVDASKLTFAKKNYDISRVINTEASLEMLYQLALGDQIESVLKRAYNIDLSKQPTINRFLARLGSVYGSHATIDLKSASDLNACALIKWLLPRQAYAALDTVRAKCIELPDGQRVDLAVFSTMGNGFTFPLQTLIFAAIVEACYIAMRLPVDNTGMVPAFSVFGDDIICVESAFNLVCNVLEFAGHTVNRSKSYNSGFFRESCGKDFFKGHDIRGIYIKKCYHETHYYSIFNRLARWSIHNGVDLSHCLRYLKGLVVFRPVPFDASDSSGIKTSLSLSGLRTKYGVTKYRALVPKPRKLSTKDYEFNHSGLLIGALGGFIEGDARRNNTIGMSHSKRTLYVSRLKDKRAWTGSFSVRDRPDGPPNVKERELSTSSWDWIPQKGLTTLDYEMLYYSL